MRVEDISSLSPWAQKQILEKLGKSEQPKAEQKQRKYGNIPVECAGIKFDSQKEQRRFLELMKLLEAGKISDLRLQCDFTLQESYTKPSGERVRGIKYRADFTYKMVSETGDTLYIVEDVKSKATKTKVYELKKKLMREKFGIEIREV
jgi:hypothetical protein